MLLNIEKIKGLWSKLLHQEASPEQIAFGFSLGFFVSFLPIFGLQTLTGIFLAFLFRTNKVSCLIGLNLHLLFFPLIPLIFYGEYLVGKHLLPADHVPSLTIKDFELLLHEGDKVLEVLRKCGQALLVGSLVLGLPLALASYWIVKSASARWQAEKKKLADTASGKSPTSRASPPP